MQKQESGRRSAIAAVVVGILVAISVAVIGAGVMILKDSYAGQFYAEPDALPLLRTAAKAAVTGEEARIPVSEVNSFVASMVEQRKAREGGSSLEQVYLQIREDQKIAAYTPVLADGMRIAVTSVCSLSYDSQQRGIRVDVEEIRFGRMKLPVGMALPMLEEKLPEGAVVTGGSIFFPIDLFELSIPETEIRLTVEDLRIENGVLVLRTNSLAQDAKNYLSDLLNQGLSDISDFLDSLWQ